jgi:rSAM/selenodomain-associated transferase 1
VKTRIVVMARAPAPGQAKTRLAQVIGDDQAAALAARMLNRTLETARLAAVGAIELCVTPDTRHPAVRAAAERAGAVLADQGEGNLGERMARIAQRVLAAGEQPLIVGTDCPSLSARHLQQAAQALQRNDAVLQPAFDGGYVLIGLRRFDPRLFEGVPWSTAAVMAITRERLRELAWSWREAETLHDIDRAADLVHLPQDWPSLASLG